MSEKNGASKSRESHETDKQEIPSAQPANGIGPTEAERAELIRALQLQALTRTDPVAANLEMLCGDLVSFASRVRQALEKESPDVPVTSSAFKGFERKTDLFLKLARQIDRFTQIQRKQSTADSAE